MSRAWEAEFARRETIHRCRVLAYDLYGTPDILSHERIARDLERFLVARHAGDEALLAVIELEARTATYLSCGQKAITHALAVLLCLAMAFSGDPDYCQEWLPR